MSDDHLLMCCCCRAASQHIVEEKDAEIARLREAIRRFADQDATLSVHGGSVTVTMDATLTDEEREAVKTAAGATALWMADNGVMEDESMRRAIVTIRGLLERLA